ncbi:MAG TPA: hypothetical protein VFR31_02755, partial [Thermoanaerobaculia bacterium]|nr:hypothetical protein [Thermoanaerobaculia bacterium]
MRRLFFSFAILLAVPFAVQADESPLAKASAALPLRSVGPGLMSGRLSDIAVHPGNPGIWYVAA